jgi:hypothetical protein
MQPMVSQAKRSPRPDLKLSVLCRVEPGCLGPDGVEHIETFCLLAQQAIQYLDADVSTWILVPRYDKTLDEMQYSLGSKILTEDQASRYMVLLGRDLSAFEERFQDKLTSLISQYLARKNAQPPQSQSRNA